MPTFAEVVQLAKSESRNGRVIGVYPETKHPTYFAREGRRLDGSLIGVSLGAKLVETLVAEGFTDPQRVYIQSFEVENLIELKHTLMPAAGVDCRWCSCSTTSIPPRPTTSPTTSARAGPDGHLRRLAAQSKAESRASRCTARSRPRRRWAG